MSDAAERSAPRPLTDRSTHDLVMEAIRRDFPQGGRGLELIDIPCGAGALSVRLREMGFRVTCSDIDPGNFEATGFPLVQADLNKPLPLEDGRFDGVASVAGIQRLYFPEKAIAEFHRILKPGGAFYLAVPNYAELRKRLRFLLYGTLGHRFDSPYFVQTTGAPEANFRFPLTYPRVEGMVRAAGFEVLRVHSRGRDLFPYLFFPITLLACAASWLRAALRPERFAGYRRGTTISMLGSKGYVIAARKP